MPIAAEPPGVPFTDHVTAGLALPVTVAVKVRAEPTCTVAAAGETATTTDGSASVTVAWPNAVVLAADVARTMTVVEAGSTAGAAYTPAALMVPTTDEPPATPFTDQVTAVLALFKTEAVKVRVVPISTVAAAGTTVTVTGGGTSVTAAWA